MTSASRKGKSKAGSSEESSENPFVAQPKPPAGEDPAQRAQRVRSLQDAIAISRRIDDDIAEAKKFHDRRKKALKILLLGQAESGKSTVLKNFQLAYAPTVFQTERVAWKRIVQLNLIRSVKTILDTLQEQWLHLSDRETNKDLRRLHMRLSPLVALIRESRALFDDDARGVCVRAGGGWKELFTRGEQRPSSDSAIINGTQLSKNDPTPLLDASRDDILALWESHEVRELLQHRNIRLEESGGFFLDDTARIARSDFIPTDNDIVRARVRTLGVEEHHFVAESGKDKGTDFFIADVGGTRSARASWVPYFDDVNAILFLAPLAFHQMLEEDPRVNRLEDSLSLWRSICENKLLAHATIILFLNKKDILAKTLAEGVQVGRHVPSYSDDNSVESVTKYFRDRFKHYHRKLSPITRTFVVYETSAIETRAMTSVVVAVHDSIIRRNLVNSDII